MSPVITGAPATDPKASAAPALLVPFTRAATEHTESFLDVSQVVTVSTTPLAPTDIPAYGFMRGVFIEVTATGGVGASVFRGDGPFNILQDLSIMDVNGAPLVGTIDGYDLYQIDKLGGYRKLAKDAKLHPDYIANTANGNFSFLLYMPIEVNARDALGALGNQNAASSYKLRTSIAPAATVYSTVPATLPTVRVRAFLDAWTQPTDVDLHGQPNATEPPAHGTTSYWSKTSFPISLGQNQIKLPRVGNYIRNLIIVFRDAAGVRNKVSFPAPLYINWDTRMLREYQPIVWRSNMAAQYQLTGTDDTAGALDTGVYSENYCHEFDGYVGAELRDGWLPTVQSTRLELVGNFGAAGTLTVLTNDVSPNGEVFV